MTDLTSGPDIQDEVGRVVAEIMTRYTLDLEIACQLALTHTPRTFWHTLHLVSMPDPYVPRAVACHWPAAADDSDSSPWFRRA